MVMNKFVDFSGELKQKETQTNLIRLYFHTYNSFKVKQMSKLFESVYKVISFRENYEL